MQNTKKYKKEQDANEFLISMKNLLKAIDLPSYNEVIKSERRGTYRRIINRFEKAFNNLQKAGLYDWEYRHRQAGDKPIPAGLNVKKWKVFQKLYIKIKILWRPVEIPKQLPNGR
jgi:hypothetical protein